MAEYIIGDIQGCYDSLLSLIEFIKFNPKKDFVWFCGDLVNRGPKSLQVVKWLMAHQDSAESVLGNHDLFTMACLAGVSKPRPKDTIQDICDAPNRLEILNWFKRRPVVVNHDLFLMSHAGFHPFWSLSETLERAKAIENVLRNSNIKDFMNAFQDRFSEIEYQPLKKPVDEPQIVESLKIFSLIRICNKRGDVDIPFGGGFDDIDDDYMPWFRHPKRQKLGKLVVFGHWAAIGYHQEDEIRAIDSGCVWGRKLTALRVGDGKIFQTPCVDPP